MTEVTQIPKESVIVSAKVNIVKWAEWVGTVAGLGAGAVLAANIPASRYAYWGYLLSNLCWAFSGWKTKSWSQLTMQMGFLAITMLGLWRWVATAV